MSLRPYSLQVRSSHPDLLRVEHSMCEWHDPERQFRHFTRKGAAARARRLTAKAAWTNPGLLLEWRVVPTTGSNPTAND